MSSINYPSKETNDHIEIINSAVLKSKVVKIKTIKNNRNLSHAFLNCCCMEYQNEEDTDRKNSISKVFMEQLLNYIKSDSKKSSEEIYDKFKEASFDEELKNKFSIQLLGKDRNIFNAVMVKKNLDNDFINLNLAYNLFSTKTSESFLPTSKFFDLININLIKSILLQRFTVKSYEEKVKNMLEDENKRDITHNDIHKYREIISYNNSFCNNLEPLNFIKILNESKENNELLLNLLSCVFKINIFLCRSWSNDISVLREINYSDDSNFIIIFKYSGKLSMTGIETKTFYESGGLKIKEDIITILNNKNHIKFIKNFRENLGSGMDNFLSEKYNNYLGSLGNLENLNNLEDKYDKELEKVKYVVLDNMDNTEDTNVDIKEDKDLLEDEGMESESELTKEELEYYENFRNSNIPYFIRNYTDNEIIKLYKNFINPDVDLNNIDRLNMEIQYTNYLNQDNMAAP